MEFLTDMVTTVPEGTGPKVDEMRAAEAVRAAELAKAGQFVRLWRPPLARRMAQYWAVPRRRRGRAPRSSRLLTASYLDESHHHAADSASQ